MKSAEILNEFEQKWFLFIQIEALCEQSVCGGGTTIARNRKFLARTTIERDSTSFEPFAEPDGERVRHREGSTSFRSKSKHVGLGFGAYEIFELFAGSVTAHKLRQLI